MDARLSWKRSRSGWKRSRSGGNPPTSGQDGSVSAGRIDLQNAGDALRRRTPVRGLLSHPRRGRIPVSHQPLTRSLEPPTVQRAQRGSTAPEVRPGKVLGFSIPLVIFPRKVTLIIIYVICSGTGDPTWSIRIPNSRALPATSLIHHTWAGTWGRTHEATLPY